MMSFEAVSAEHTNPVLRSHILRAVQSDGTAEVGRKWFVGGADEEGEQGHIGNRSLAEELRIALEIDLVVGESVVGSDMVRVAGLGTAEVAVRDTAMAVVPGLAGLAGHSSQLGAAAIRPVPAVQTDAAAAAVAGIAPVADIAADTVLAVGMPAAGTARAAQVQVVRIAPVVGTELASWGEWGTLGRPPELVQARPGNSCKDCSSGKRLARTPQRTKTPPETP